MEDKFSDLFIEKKMTIKNAMKMMDKAARKILFVTDKRKRLLGTVTDGDIRRWILADGSLSKKIDRVYNTSPTYLKKIDEGISKKEVQKIVLETGLESIPVVNNTGQIVDVLFWKDMIKGDLINPRKRALLNVPVVIMSGGQGTRLDPFTKILPKALIPIGDKPVIEVIIANFLKYTSGAIYLILGYKKEMIKSYFDNNPVHYRIQYIYEGPNPLGTVGGLGLIPENFPDTFFLSNCDTVIKAGYDDIYALHRKNRNDLTVVSSMQHFVLSYGVININSDGELKKIEEKPEYDFLVNTGMYVIEKKILRFIPPKKPFHITDLIKEVKRQKGKIGVYPVSEKSWLDVGRWESYREITKDFFAE
ncbi:MAG: sugar phosphate nucleotidyltransferase [Omnitrophica bacterium]|nr:sugar phosphate nucleotidyltransferase [Candidatus Omnitrophota bacterium]